MDPGVEAALIGALAGAVLGVLGTYVFDVRQAEAERAEREKAQERERRRHRETVATALLQDLRRTEFDLREIFHADQPTRIAIKRPSLLYDVLRQEIRWFAASSVQSIAEFFRRVDHLYSGLEAVRAAAASAAIRQTPERDYEIKVHAAFALQALSGAVRALQAEGGMIPGPIDWPSVTFPTLPTIPTPVFDDAAARLVQRNAESPGV